MLYTSQSKRYKPRNTNYEIVKYVDQFSIDTLKYFTIISIAALANSEGGRIIFGRRRRGKYNSSIYEGIPYSMEQVIVSLINTIIMEVPKYITKFPINGLDRGWEPTDESHRYYVLYIPNYSDTLLEINWPEKKLVKTIFVRENNNTVRYGVSTISKSSREKRLKYEILKPCLPHKENYYLVNTDNPIEYGYKYMSLESFVLSLIRGTWQFVEPTKWNDEYEGRFYHADYSNIVNQDNCPPQLFATCITGEKANEAAWKVYANGQGLGSKCVQIKINMTKLREILSGKIEKIIDNNSEEVDGTFYEGKVYYDFSNDEINSLHTLSSPYNKTFFSNFCNESFLKLLLIKRKAYEYEKEIRLFFVPKCHKEINKTKRKGKGESLKIKINWSEVIEEIIVDKKCTEGELETVYMACSRAGINYRKAGTPGKKDNERVQITLFNVDEMEGKRVIKISPAKES